MYLVSACLMGRKCKYNGESNYDPGIVEFSSRVETIEVCPEELGGLPTPRTPCEIVGERVISKDGQDFTEEFKAGAKETLRIAKEYGIDRAILKSKSPSCGMHRIYDGTFSGRLKTGMGVTAKLLSENNIKIYSEKDMELLSKNFKDQKKCKQKE